MGGDKARKNLHLFQLTGFDRASMHHQFELVLCEDLILAFQGSAIATKTTKYKRGRRIDSARMTYYTSMCRHAHKRTHAMTPHAVAPNPMDDWWSRGGEDARQDASACTGASSESERERETEQERESEQACERESRRACACLRLCVRGGARARVIRTRFEAF